MSAGTAAVALDAEFARHVREGLSGPGQKKLSPFYFYDEIGSALFETITLLPEYGLTNADERLLRLNADAIIERISGPVAVAELGSGTGRKTRWLLEAAARRHPVSYYPIEISGSALARCRDELGGLRGVSIVGFECSYLEGLQLAVGRRRPGEKLLVLFLGSTIGNFERQEASGFLAQVRRHLQPGDALLLGTDLVKPRETLLRAYDDPTGVTAAFNLNLLGRINRELGGEFNLRSFAHEARWNEPERRVEIHLRSRVAQTVAIRSARLRAQFEEGETIWTESCHKYTLDELPLLARRAGFRHTAEWVDSKWPFAENLWIAAP